MKGRSIPATHITLSLLKLAIAAENDLNRAYSCQRKVLHLYLFCYAHGLFTIVLFSVWLLAASSAFSCWEWLVSPQFALIVKCVSPGSAHHNVICINFQLEKMCCYSYCLHSWLQLILFERYLADHLLLLAVGGSCIRLCKSLPQRVRCTLMVLPWSQRQPIM